MKLTKEIKAAIIVIAGIVCFILGFNFLKSKSLFGSDNVYHLIFNHSGGLKTGTPVTVNGIQIGTVDYVGIDDKTAKVNIEISCTRDFSFSKNSKAELFSSLLGNTGLQIVPVFDDAPKAKSGDTLNASVQVGLLESLTSKIEPTQVKLNKLLSQADSTMTTINAVLDEQTASDLKKAISNLNVTLANLNQSSRSLNQMLETNKGNLEATLQNANKITENLAKVSDTIAQAELDKILDDAQKMLTNLNKMMASMEKGEGSLGKLMNDEKLYTNLEGASKQLELLLEDFRLNPKRYIHFSVFGRKAKPYEATAQEAEKVLDEAEVN